jgi:hypothetical protein
MTVLLPWPRDFRAIRAAMTSQTRRTLGIVALVAGLAVAAISAYLMFSAGVGSLGLGGKPVDEPGAAPLGGIALGAIIAVLGLIAIVYKSDEPQVPAE